MTLKHIGLGLLVLLQQLYAGAQPRPPQLQWIDAVTDTGSVVYREKLTEDERSFYWQGTTRKAAGYFEIRVPADYLATPRRIAEYASPVTAARSPGHVQVIGSFRESPNRSNAIIAFPSGVGVLTRWNFAADGARIFLVREFQNVQVGGSMGTIALAVAADVHSTALWKLTWNNGVTQFELMIPDKLERGEPTLDPNAILKLAVSALHATEVLR